MQINQIEKRDGSIVPFDRMKIYNAVLKAFTACDRKDRVRINRSEDVEAVVRGVESRLFEWSPEFILSVEGIQNIVEEVLTKHNYDVGKAYILYRKKRENVRKRSETLMNIYKDLLEKDARENEIKRENANIDGNTAMGTMLKFGSEGSKLYYETDIIAPEFAVAHRSGDIHIHDEDFYALTLTCCQIDLVKLLNGGFSTGYGHIREPNDIRTYAALACIAIQANQNDQHGGQSIPNFDYAMSEGIVKTFIKEVARSLDFFGYSEEFSAAVEVGLKKIYAERGTLIDLTEEIKALLDKTAFKFEIPVKEEKGWEFLIKKSRQYTEKAALQAMEALIHNLNTMHSRAGAQIPFSSLNYGTDTTSEGRLAVKSILEATYRGLGGGETPIFPIQIFKVKDGVSGEPGDINYDLFEMACMVSAKRLFPNFAFLDASFNAEFYREGRPETEVAYMGCRTRVLANNYDKESAVTYGRGNLSFTSINLPRIGIKTARGEVTFWDELDRLIDLSVRQLLERFEIQARRKAKNFPFLMGQGIWHGSDKLDSEDEVREVIKHGTLTMGFIGLAECLAALTGYHHGQSDKSWELGYEIVSHMRLAMDKASKGTGLNFSLLATPAEGLSGRFVAIDRKIYGKLEGITDRNYYTNSFHIPVHYRINAFRKIELEAPFHTLTNGGHITYVEMDGDPSKNIDAFIQIIQAMKREGVGYGSINHDLDRCPVCGYQGVIDDECPGCGRKEGEAVELSSLPLAVQKKILKGGHI
jgi:ribonucleoside-triphosphate reductase